MPFLKRFSAAIKVTYGSHQGAILALTAVVFFAACVAAISLQSGFGRPADFLFVALVAFIGIPLAALAIASILALFRLLPRLFTGLLVSASAFVSLLWLNTPWSLFVAVFILVECGLGAAIASLLRKPSRAKRALAWTVLVLAVAANVELFRFLHSDGIDDDLLSVTQNQSSLPPPLTAADPSEPGPYQVQTLFYGSGNSLRRPEFGSSVAIRTSTVNASPFFKDFDGWKAFLRKRYWGFGMDQLPLNAQVFYPTGSGPFPLFLIVHGNHVMSVPSDHGYAYLCQLLASRGFIAVSVDETFLNSGLFHDPPKQQAVRAWLLLEHLHLWHQWMTLPANPFFAKVDLNKIALAGHSRGGEAVATAALFNKLAYYPDDANVRFNYNYAIKSVIAIAPADGQYKPADQWRVLNDLNYLTLQGSNDSDVSSFEGSRQYDHVRFSGTMPAFKSELYIYRANHGQFNTMWGRSDLNIPASWFLNLHPLLKADEQRQIAKVYVSAFLEATLHDNPAYVDLFRDYRSGRHWLPDTLYVNRFEDESYKAVCSFDEDADLTTTTIAGGHIAASGFSVWREGKIPFRSGNRDYNGVFLGWNWEKTKKAPGNVPNYAIGLPPGMHARALALSVAVTDDDAPDPQNKSAKTGNEVEEKDDITDFSVEAVSENEASARITANSFMPLLPPLHTPFTKLDRLDRELYKSPSEPVFQTIRIPFSAFQIANSTFDPAHVKRVRLIFDKTPSRVIIISKIGLSK